MVSEDVLTVKSGGLKASSRAAGSAIFRFNARDVRPGFGRLFKSLIKFQLIPSLSEKFHSADRTVENRDGGTEFLLLVHS